MIAAGRLWARTKAVVGTCVVCAVIGNAGDRVDEDYLKPNFIHVYPENENHVISGWPDKLCWCEPEIEDYRDACGGVLILHRQLQ